MNNIFKRLDFVIAESEAITKHFDNTKREEITLFSLCIIDRLNFSSESLKLLMNNFLTNTKVDYSSGIIIRASLLDYLIVLNAMEIFGRNENSPEKVYPELKDYCLMMLCDTVRHTLRYFENLENQFSKEVIGNMYINLVAMNPECFEPYNNDGSKPTIKVKEHRSPEKLFNTLMSSKYLKKYRGVYEAYLYYSKYDHFGQMFYSLSRRNPVDQLANIDKAIKEFPKSLLFTVIILETLYGSDQFIKTKRQTITSFIDEMENV